MKHFRDIDQQKVEKKNYLKSLNELKECIKDSDNPIFSDNINAVKMYYNNAIKMGADSNFFNNKIIKKINSLNESINTEEIDSRETIVENISYIIDTMNEMERQALMIPLVNNVEVELLNENSAVAEVGSVNGMGDVSLPSIDGEIGSGDVPGGTASAEKQEPAPTNETKRMKKFEDIHKETIQEKQGEIYYNINDFGDTAGIITALSSELSKKYKVEASKINSELLNINISYNGTVDIKSIDMLSKLLGTTSNKLKKDIDSIIDMNIHLLEEVLYEAIMKVLNGEQSINEGIIGRVLGGIGGFALGPKIGKVIAKVLGIQKGPIYNLLTSRVVGAALAQELTKNLI